MTRFLCYAMIFSICLVILAAAPVAAQVIKKGTDYWRTPANGATQFTFPEGDVESLCRAQPQSAWDHRVALRGIPTPGSDWDSAVARLKHAKFDANGNAHTEVQFEELALASMAPSDTPCGRLNWEVGLAKGKQPITPMTISRTSGTGGVFFAALALRVEMRATDAATGAYVGSLFYDVRLPDPAGGTPWSYGPGNVFRPGMDTADNCIQVLRNKLGNYPPGSQHFYFISDLIAQGRCERQ